MQSLYLKSGICQPILFPSSQNLIINKNKINNEGCIRRVKINEIN